MSSKAKTPAQPNVKPVVTWLYVTAFFVFAMAIIGAITRLTESGLSMVEWRPLIGAIPPLNEDEWQRVFNLYKETSEYQLAHSWMGIEDFKTIFFWEWFHRLWGRLIGVVYAIPFFYFLSRGNLPKQYRLSFWFFLILGGCQGLMGWYMVMSGFADRVDVSHYRLAAHLSLAFVIFALLIDMAHRLQPEKAPDNAAHLYPLRPWIAMSFISVFVTIIWGAFVAGLNAGLIYDSFPLMGEYPWPDEIFHLSPIWMNAFENHATVQFTHRALAMLSMILTLLTVFKSRHFALADQTKRLFRFLALMVVFQVALGITTLMTGVHIVPAVLHQGGALILITLLIGCYHQTVPKSYSYA